MGRIPDGVKVPDDPGGMGPENHFVEVGDGDGHDHPEEKNDVYHLHQRKPRARRFGLSFGGHIAENLLHKSGVRKGATVLGGMEGQEGVSQEIAEGVGPVHLEAILYDGIFMTASSARESGYLPSSRKS